MTHIRKKSCVYKISGTKDLRNPNWPSNFLKVSISFYNKPLFIQMLRTVSKPHLHDECELKIRRSKTLVAG